MIDAPSSFPTLVPKKSKGQYANGAPHEVMQCWQQRYTEALGGVIYTYYGTRESDGDSTTIYHAISWEEEGEVVMYIEPPFTGKDYMWPSDVALYVQLGFPARVGPLPYTRESLTALLDAFTPDGSE